MCVSFGFFSLSYLVYNVIMVICLILKLKLIIILLWLFDNYFGNK